MVLLLRANSADFFIRGWRQQGIKKHISLFSSHIPLANHRYESTEQQDWLGPRSFASLADRFNSLVFCHLLSSPYSQGTGDRGGDSNQLSIHHMEKLENIGAFVITLAAIVGFGTWYSSKTSALVEEVSEKYVVVCDSQDNCGFADK